MKKRHWVFLALAPFIFTAFVALTLRALFPPAKLRALAEQQIGVRMNRQAEIGPVRLGFSGITIESLRLSEVPAFKSGTFLSARGIRLRWDLRTLWQGLSLKQKLLTQTRGDFRIDRLENLHYTAQDFSVQWSLSDMDPTWSRLNGWARLEQGPGRIRQIDRLVASSPSAKLIFAPLQLLTGLGRLGVLNLGLPDLKNWPIDRIRGDYEFKNGTMKIRSFGIASPQLGMTAQGAIELATGKLAVDVRVQSPKRAVLGALDLTLNLSGTLSSPKTNLQSLKKKMFKATLQNL